MANIIEKAEDYVSTAKIDEEVLSDKLSEFLAVERGGIKLYERALEYVMDSAVSEKFREFLEQTAITRLSFCALLLNWASTLPMSVQRRKSRSKRPPGY